MTSDVAKERKLITPMRVVTLLTLLVVMLGGAVFVAWLSGPRTVTLEVTEPAGKIIVFHLVVDGRAESREGFAPVTYQFDAKELRYAVICLDAAAPSEVTIHVHDASGTGGNRTTEGVTGTYRSTWWGTTFQMEAMTPTHVATMRKSVIADREGKANPDLP